MSYSFSRLATPDLFHEQISHNNAKSKRRRSAPKRKTLEKIPIQSDEPEVAKVAIVKKKYVSKKRSVSTAVKDTAEVQRETAAPAVKKKSTTIGKASTLEKDLTLVVVAQEAVPIQAVEPISIVPAERPHAKERKAPKRKLRLSTGSDDEIVEKESAVETVVAKQKGTTSVDDVDTIIEQVIAETAQMEIDVVKPDFSESVAMGTDLKDMEEDSVKYRDTDVQLVESATGKEIDPKPVEDLRQLPLDEESLSIDLLKRITGDMMLPSVFAAEPAKIKFSNGISITGVANGDWFKENLPKIAIADKGKAPLVKPDTIKGHPAREMFHLICDDIEFLVQLREKVIDEVAAFISSFSLRCLAVLKSLNGIAANEEQVLTWGEIYSVQVALQRRLYIVAKYRELLLRKFLESHRANFSFGQPWSAMALQIIELLSTAHSTAVKDLLT
ncbi:hypothetical protein F511_08684 [Dorcoceras hygrometricum]|uniref:Splicing factor 3B subunit 1-like n=1 Tax=Dorcoceras hygrometricum TaxID=472368 RepID=A0A2Z7CGQ4_9LAMI|nr:hypothetical protein F511_08684 [Dorcoceras hygrometricum]